jgi:hypothetical protein
MYLTAEAKSLLVALLNRNPAKRLGSGKGDAEEIKKHPWFKTINWVDAINKKLKPPKPVVKQFPPGKISGEIFHDDSKDENPIQGWMYKRPSNI